MRRLPAALIVALQLMLAAAAAGDEAPPSVPPDPLVASLVAQVSAARLRATDERLVAFGTRNTFSTGQGTVRGVTAARDWIAARFREIAHASGGRMSVALDWYTQPKLADTPRAVEVSSVVATLRGDEPGGRTYVISSHYDSRNTDNFDAVRDAPGADDNASAVSAVLEAARILASRHFAGTILFAAYDGEEQGLWGSEHHAATLQADAIPVEGDLNSDIIGASRGHDGVPHAETVRLYSPGVMATDATGSGELARFAKASVERYVANFHVDLVERADRIQRGGDQMSFQHHGFPAVRFVEESEDYDHQHQDVRTENGREYGDLLKFEDFDYLARVTSGLVATLSELALGPARPAGAIEAIGRQLDYDANLRWTAVPGAASYDVVWRRTTDAQWTAARNVGNVTTATIPGYSRDIYVFGVRAVDASGRRSVVSPCNAQRV